MKAINPNKIKRILTLFLAGLLTVVSIAACDRKTPEETPETGTGQAADTEKTTVEEAVEPVGNEDEMKQAAFEEKLMAYLSEKTEGNYMVSPLSFRYALGLLLTGASGETKAELLKALGVESEEEWTEACLRFNSFAERFEETFGKEKDAFEENVKSGFLPEDAVPLAMALRVANSVWKNEKLSAPFTDAYQESVSKNYDAEYFSFTEDTAVSRINEWVNEKTERLIDRLLPDDYDTEMLAVVLMNALYFKDSWLSTFDEDMTETGEFRTASGETVEKEFMHDTETLEYYEDENTRLVVLPMKGGVSMAFVLGDATDIAAKIEAADYVKVRVSIPKFDLETSFSSGELVDFLKANGVEKAFDPERADFSRMLDGDVFVSDIIQKTRIKLNEDGVEAAAVTAMLMCGNGYDPSEPVDFTLDQPFSFFIYTNTGNEMATMFAGEIVE